jgi:Fungal hydrophobin
MLSYKSLFSLVTAFAVASSVAASATPVRRGGGGGLPGYSPSLIPPIPKSECQQQNIQCCNTVTSQNDPHIDNILGGVGMMNDMDPNLLAGQSCSPIAGGGTW